MRSAYVTKRIAPQGYVAVTRKLAEILYNEGYPVTVCGNNVNSFHVFNGWHLGYTLNKQLINEFSAYDHTFESLLCNFMFHLEKELGTYPVFYVRQEVINNMDLSILKGSAV